MISFLLIRKIEGATLKTGIVQGRLIIQHPGAQVDKVLVKPIQEIVVKEATAEEEEDHRVETEEIQRAQLMEEDSLRKWNVSAAEAQIIKLWNVVDSKNTVAPDARIADSTMKPSFATKEEPTINLPEEVEKKNTGGKRWTTKQKE